MRATGIIRRMDDLGRVVIPKEVRRSLRLSENAPMEIFVEDDKLILVPYKVGEELSKALQDVADEIQDAFGVDDPAVEQVRKIARDLRTRT